MNLQSEKRNVHVQVVLRENYSNVEVSLNMSLKVSVVAIETGCPPPTLNSLYTSFKYHLRMVGHGFLINPTHYMIYIFSNSVHPCIVKLISPLELCGTKIFC